VYVYATNHAYNFSHYGSGKGGTHPVQNVNWHDAVKWCNARAEQAGLQPVYYTNAELTVVYRKGEGVPYANWSPNGYRLPTEAEWEKAARSGLVGIRFPWGGIISQTNANYFGPSGYNAIGSLGGYPYTSPVGSFAANGYGLFDMAGNVWQWCWDCYDAPYTGGVDPHGPELPSWSSRVLRGGSFGVGATEAQCSFRNNVPPSSFSDDVGFRCVRGH
jgi:formylglycine-generating enzyme required for sulfatase activity